MNTIPLHLKVKFAEAVWHDQPYLHPQLRQQVEKDFYDRKKPRKIAEPVLWALMGKPIVFVGERRAGKTSMLKLLMHLLENDPRFIPVDIPWLGIQSADDLMHELLDNLYFKLDLDNTSLREAFLQIRTTAEFRRTMTNILKYVPDKFIVFGIDEFDSIIIDQGDETKRHEIISVISSIVESQSLPVKLVLTMTRELSKLEKGHASPLTARAEQIRLEPFSKAELDEMILGIAGQEVALSEQDLESIFDLSGGWPYFAKALLYHLIQLPSDGRLEQAREKAVRDHSLSDALEHIYQKHWDNSEKTIILLVAQRGGHITAEEMSVVEQSIKSAAKELVKRGYLLEKEDNYRFRIGLLQDWFLQWTRFEEQAQKYLKDILTRLERREDGWAGSEDEIIQISPEEVKRRGFS
jgi:hypothetical protein